MTIRRAFDLFADVSFAARRLRRTPAFTVAAITLLGVGMAIAAAAASLVNVALFKRPAEERELDSSMWPASRVPLRHSCG